MQHSKTIIRATCPSPMLQNSVTASRNTGRYYWILACTYTYLRLSFLSVSLSLSIAASSSAFRSKEFKCRLVLYTVDRAVTFVRLCDGGVQVTIKWNATNAGASETSPTFWYFGSLTCTLPKSAIAILKGHPEYKSTNRWAVMQAWILSSFHGSSSLSD